MANPFKDKLELEEEIATFLKKHKSFISNQGNRISDFFEMCCYNYVVKYYQSKGYDISVQNLINNQFKYKLSTKGYPKNFSFFKISKTINVNSQNQIVEFEIHHNLTVESEVDDEIYTTPDIVVINAGKIIEDAEHYSVANSSLKYCYVKNKDLQTFCEVKQFNPFPELLFNFIGVLLELKSTYAIENSDQNEPQHLAPTLLISGKGNLHTDKIKISLENRYYMNIIYDVFEYKSKPLINSQKNIKTIPSSNPLYKPLEAKLNKQIDIIDLPF